MCQRPRSVFICAKVAVFRPPTLLFRPSTETIPSPAGGGATTPEPRKLPSAFVPINRIPIWVNAFEPRLVCLPLFSGKQRGTRPPVPVPSTGRRLPPPPTPGFGPMVGAMDVRCGILDRGAAPAPGHPHPLPPPSSRGAGVPGRRPAPRHRPHRHQEHRRHEGGQGHHPRERRLPPPGPAPCTPRMSEFPLLFF